VNNSRSPHGERGLKLNKPSIPHLFDHNYASAMLAFLFGLNLFHNDKSSTLLIKDHSKPYII